jgi:hypothetical protein
VKISEVKAKASALARLAQAVIASQDGPGAIIASVQDDLSKIRAVGIPKDDTVRQHVEALTGKGAGILTQATVLKTDVATWIKAFGDVDAAVRSDPNTMKVLADTRKGLIFGTDDGPLARSIRGQQIMVDLAKKIDGLIAAAAILKARAATATGNAKTFHGEAQDIENAVTGGGLLNKIIRLEELPGQIIGKTLGNIVNPISGVVTTALVVLGVAGFAYIAGPGIIAAMRKGKADHA